MYHCIVRKGTGFVKGKWDERFGSELLKVGANLLYLTARTLRGGSEFLRGKILIGKNLQKL